MPFDPLKQNQPFVPNYPSSTWEKQNVDHRNRERMLAMISLSVVIFMLAMTLLVFVR
jgi:hypothetical protein